MKCVSVSPDGSTMWNETWTGLPGATGPEGRKAASWKVFAGATVGTEGEPEPDDPHAETTIASATSATETPRAARGGHPRNAGGKT